MILSVNGRYRAARPTGVQRVAAELVEALARRADVRVRLHLPRGARPPAGSGGSLEVVPGILPPRPWEQLELPWRRSREPGAVGLDPANSGPVLFSAARSGGNGPASRSRVICLHDVFPLTRPEWYRPTFRRWFAAVPAASARRAARVVCFTRAAREEVVEALGVPPERVRVISQGAGPLDGPTGPSETRAVLAAHGLAPGYLLALGAGDRRKNVGFLLDVVGRWREAGGDPPPLVLVGEGYGHVHAGPPERSLPGVRRLGSVSDATLRALLTGAGAFCFPSLAEGFGRPPLEALACGTPVVAATYPAASEVLGDAARLVPLDADAWIAALGETLALGESDREAVADRGRSHARDFTWERAADQLLAVCAEVAGDPASLAGDSAATPGGSASMVADSAATPGDSAAMGADPAATPGESASASGEEATS